MNPIIMALRELGGSAGTQDVYDKIIELYEVSEEELSQKHRSGISVIINDIDWAKNYLGYEGFLDSNSPRGIWTLSKLGEGLSSLTNQLSLQNEIFNDLIEKITELNEEIKKDDSLGEGFQIGHSYFCGQNQISCTDERMKSVVYFDIIPLLREYWFDDKETVQRWKNNLSGVFNDE